MHVNAKQTFIENLTLRNCFDKSLEIGIFGTAYGNK